VSCDCDASGVDEFEVELLQGVMRRHDRFGTSQDLSASHMSVMGCNSPSLISEDNCCVR